MDSLDAADRMIKAMQDSGEQSAQAMAKHTVSQQENVEKQVSAAKEVAAMHSAAFTQVRNVFCGRLTLMCSPDGKCLSMHAAMLHALRTHAHTKRGCVSAQGCDTLAKAVQRSQLADTMLKHMLENENKTAEQAMNILIARGLM